ncbi:MAG: glycosyltransferase family 4 protein [Eubacterium sp.]|nr:glycosyltransferase family 4 protein [Eubacterium sp.]
MKILIVNAILYTNETHEVKKVESIKDTMIYDLCIAFNKAGHEVTLLAAEDYKPTADEEYPFEIVWAKAKFKKLFPANILPCCTAVKRIVRENNFDLIISSEVFSLNSFMLVSGGAKDKVIIWQELAKHNNLMHKLPSKFWYNIVARLFYRNVTVVARSEEAREFISKYCANVSDKIIDHGVNLDKFTPCKEKENYFIIPSQLIARKQIDRSIEAFAEFAEGKDFYLYIFGEGDEEANLKKYASSLGVADKIRFFGKAPHETLKEYMAKAQAMLIYTRQDNNMVSVIEAIACGTPIVTTSVPYNSAYIDSTKLGIVNDSWGAADLEEIVNNNAYYVNNCLNYRDELSDGRRVEQFLELI